MRDRLREAFERIERGYRERAAAFEYKNNRAEYHNGWLVRRTHQGCQVGFLDQRHPDGECWFDQVGSLEWASECAFRQELLPGWTIRFGERP
jgi:hypothetical protein